MIVTRGYHGRIVKSDGVSPTQIDLKGAIQLYEKDENKDNCDLDNLVTLCRPCHGRVTMDSRWSKEVEVKLNDYN
jgi:5-methylcytosine-specific restriction endonuclease McrA